MINCSMNWRKLTLVIVVKYYTTRLNHELSMMYVVDTSR